MPQELHVVNCYKCNTYQVDIVKKVKKWTCKMCGEKQSLIKIYGNGTGKECRALVQHLNSIRFSQGELEICNKIETQQESDNENEFTLERVCKVNVDDKSVFNEEESNEEEHIQKRRRLNDQFPISKSPQGYGVNIKSSQVVNPNGDSSINNISKVKNIFEDNDDIDSIINS